MNSIQNEILAAINTNDLRAIETVLNGLGVEAAIANRRTDDECLHVDGFGVIVFDGRMEECPGYFVRTEDCDDIVEPDELAALLAEVVEFCQAIA